MQNTTLDAFWKEATAFAYAHCEVLTDAVQVPQALVCRAASPGFAQVFDTTPDELVGRPLQFPDVDLLAQIKTGARSLFTYAKSGKYYKIECCYSSESHELSLLLVEISQDLEDYFRAKHSEADEQFLRVFHSSEDAMLLIDNGIFIECNDVIVRFLGYKDKKEFLMQHPSALSPEFQPCGTSSAAKADQMIGEAIRKGSHRFEWVHLKADGSPVLVEVSLSFIVFQGRSIVHCIWRDLSEQKRLEAEIRQQQERMLEELSAPITELWENILLLPLVGGMSTERAQTILLSVLQKIADTQSKAFILDISGIALVDTAVANSFIKLAKATKLMGCSAIISGVSPAVAQTVVELGIQIDEIDTTANLQDALSQALERTGLRISKQKKKG